MSNPGNIIFCDSDIISHYGGHLGFTKKQIVCKNYHFHCIKWTKIWESKKNIFLCFRHYFDLWWPSWIYEKTNCLPKLAFSLYKMNKNMGNPRKIFVCVSDIISNYGGHLGFFRCWQLAIQRWRARGEYICGRGRPTCLVHNVIDLVPLFWSLWRH